MSLQAFRDLAQAIDPDLTMSSDRSFELVWAEEAISARVFLAPGDEQVIADLFLHDVAPFAGTLRDSLNRAVLTVNAQAARRSDFVLGVDSRSYLVLTGFVRLHGLDADGLMQRLAWWRSQGLRCRSLAMAVGLQGAEPSFEVTAVDTEEAV